MVGIKPTLRATAASLRYEPDTDPLRYLHIALPVLTMSADAMETAALMFRDAFAVASTSQIRPATRSRFDIPPVAGRARLMKSVRFFQQCDADLQRQTRLAMCPGGTPPRVGHRLLVKLRVVAEQCLRCCRKWQEDRLFGWCNDEMRVLLTPK
jgi:hypothetical protein